MILQKLIQLSKFMPCPSLDKRIRPVVPLLDAAPPPAPASGASTSSSTSMSAIGSHGPTPTPPSAPAASHSSASRTCIALRTRIGGSATLGAASLDLGRGGGRSKTDSRLCGTSSYPRGLTDPRDEARIGSWGGIRSRDSTREAMPWSRERSLLLRFRALLRDCRDWRELLDSERTVE